MKTETKSNFREKLFLEIVNINALLHETYLHNRKAREIRQSRLQDAEKIGMLSFSLHEDSTEVRRKEGAIVYTVEARHFQALRK